MMKKIAIVIISLSFTPLLSMAQNNWQLPESEKSQPVEKSEKIEKKAKKDSDDRAYLAGAVPEKDGNVVFTFNNSIKNNGAEPLDAETLYQKTYKWIEEMTKGKEQIDSRIALVNKDEHKIAAKFSEWLEFSRSFISVDRTRFNYVLTAECKDEMVTLEISRIFYHYDEDRPTKMDVSAEEWISDAKALNKNGTKLYRGNKKFRKGTIIRVNEINNSFIQYMGTH